MAEGRASRSPRGPVEYLARSVATHPAVGSKRGGRALGSLSPRPIAGAPAHRPEYLPRVDRGYPACQRPPSKLPVATAPHLPTHPPGAFALPIQKKRKSDRTGPKVPPRDYAARHDDNHRLAAPTTIPPHPDRRRAMRATWFCGAPHLSVAKPVSHQRDRASQRSACRSTAWATPWPTRFHTRRRLLPNLDVHRRMYDDTVAPFLLHMSVGAR